MNFQIPSSESLEIETKQDLIRYQKKNYEKFVQWVINNPPDPRLAEIARRDLRLKLPRKTLQTKLKSIIYLVFTDPSKLYGKNYVTPRLKTNARNTAIVSDLANLFNNITAIPFIYYIFKDMQEMGIALAALVSLIIFLITNALAVSSVAGRRIAIVLLLLSHFLLTGVSGIGSELLVGQNQIATDFAVELNNENFEKLDKDKEKSIEELRKQINELTEKLNQLEAELNKESISKRKYNRIFIEINGEWKDRNRDWSTVPFENLPLSQKILRRQSELNSNLTQLNRNKAEANKKRQELGEIGFLKYSRYDIFQENFNENLHLRSGKEASKIAFQSFFDDLSSFRFHAISSSLFFMGFSLITSVAALGLLKLLSSSYDMKRSNDPEIALLRSEFIDIVQQQLHKAQ